MIYVPPLPCDIPGRVHGLDVSAEQPRLPMGAVVVAGVHWIDCKATESTWHDHMFATHVADTRAAELHAGAYHYLHSTDPWKPQADAYLRAVDGLDLKLRPSLDWEDAKRIIVYYPNSERIDWAATTEHAKVAVDCALGWLGYVHDQSGRRPTVYTGKFMTDIFKMAGVSLAPLLDYDLWQAAYRFGTDGRDYHLTAPQLIVVDGHAWDPRAWQWCGDGGPRIAGVSFNLDRDVLFGDGHDFDVWCADHPIAPSTIPSPPPPPPDPRTVLQHGGGTLADEQHSIMYELTHDDDEPDTPAETPAARRTTSSPNLPALKPNDTEPEDVADSRRRR